VDFGGFEPNFRGSEAEFRIGVWDGTTGRRLLTLRDRLHHPYPVALSADGGRLATLDGTVHVWDVATGRELLTLKSSAHQRAAFSPDGTRLASGGLDLVRRDNEPIMQLWDLATGREIAPCGGHTGQVNCLSFSPDSTRVASGGSDGLVKVWDAATGREVLSLTHGPNSTFVGGVAFSPDGRRLASLGLDGILKFWDTSNGQNTLTLRAFDPLRPYSPLAAQLSMSDELRNLSMVRVLAFSPDGHRLVSDEPGGVVRVWDATPGSAVRPAEVPAETPAETPRPARTWEQRARWAIDQARRSFDRIPDSAPYAAPYCNSLARAYLTAPEPLRDAAAGLRLAEKAVWLAPGEAAYRATLGVAYYRAGRYRDAAEVLRSNLARRADAALACDLYFLAMSHHRLGDADQARAYYDWALRWSAAQRNLTPDQREELSLFRAEAEELLGGDR
jgi:hypothetical protein